MLSIPLRRQPRPRSDVARIRTIKPEFWEDEVVGCLSRDARLLFVATWNIADDEGLLRWSAAYIKASAFMYDDDIQIKDAQRLMGEIVEAGLVHAYNAGKAQQPFAYIVNFQKHQRINRPSPSRLPPPPLGCQPTKELYGKRDGWICHLCGTAIDQVPTELNEDFTISLDHIHTVSAGGMDYPTNIRAAHQTCNKGRGNRSVEEYQKLVIDGKTVAQIRFPERFKNRLTDVSVSTSLPDGDHGSGSGKEGIKDQGPTTAAARPTRTKVSRETVSEWWLDFKLAYPSRAGGQPWRRAQKAASARIAEGHAPDELIAGARRYAAFIEATGKSETEYVQQAATFLGPDKHFLLPWHAPPKAESATARLLRNLNGTTDDVIEHEPDIPEPRSLTHG